jgi:hypothetical protein
MQEVVKIDSRFAHTLLFPCPECNLPVSVVRISDRKYGEEVHDDIWLVSFMDYDLGYFDLETRVLEPLENPFGPKVLPMS